MAAGLVGRKCGMTQIPLGEVSIPVTVIEVLPNRVVQQKTAEKDGYFAIQVTTGARKSSRISKPEQGHFAKAGVEAGRGLWEFRLDSEAELAKYPVGAEVGPAFFQTGQKVDVIGISKGHGFSGPIQRWNFSSQRASHGNSLSHRAPGSIGQNQSPGRVFKGKKMAGHWGSDRVTVLSLEIVKIDLEKNVILVKGSVPGAPNSDLVLRPAVKSPVAAA